MAVEFIMPKLGLTMEQGTIGRWLVADGATVSVGDAVAEIETDKVETEIECSGSGVLRLVGKVGTTYDCGALIGWICEPGETPPGVDVGSPSAPAAAERAATQSSQAPPAAAGVVTGAVPLNGGRIAASPNAKRVAQQLNVPLAAIRGTGPEGRIVSEDVERASAAGITAVTASPVASPGGVHPGAAPSPAPGAWGTVASATFAAVQLARMLGLDANEVPTASADGVVTRDDVAEHARALIARVRSGATTPLPAASAAPQTSPAAPAAAPGAPSAQYAGLSPMRRVIAQRMSESLHGMAQLTLTTDVDMAVVMADRRRRLADGAAPGYTDYVIKACAIALRSHPYVNSSLTPTGIEVQGEINVGMAVAVDGGLLVPVVRSADALLLADLSAETTRLAEAARAGRLALREMEGGTFSVSALGMFGVDVFTPIINPPNAAILGVGRIRTDVAWVDGAAAPVSRMTLSLTWDHRVFDGAPAAEFARAVKATLEDPALWPTA